MAEECKNWYGVVDHFLKPDSKCPDPAHENLRKLVKAAMAKERERCAEIADSFCEWRDTNNKCSQRPHDRCIECEVAEKIREGK